jgi:hypothetical protein
MGIWHMICYFFQIRILTGSIPGMDIIGAWDDPEKNYKIEVFILAFNLI